jgi:hypothetical protein
MRADAACRTADYFLSIAATALIKARLAWAQSCSPSTDIFAIAFNAHGGECIAIGDPYGLLSADMRVLGSGRPVAPQAQAS